MTQLSELLDDEELGFVDAAMSGAKLLGKGFKALGKIGKKKKKKPAAPANKVIQMDAQNIQGSARPDYLFPGASANQTMANAGAMEIAKAVVKAKTKGGGGARDIVKEVVAAVPPLIRQQVLDALKEANNAGAQKNQTMQSIASQVDDVLKPQVLAMLGALQAQNTSAQATYEHRELVNREDFQRNTKEGMANILARLDQVESNLDARLKNPKLALVTRKLPFFGPKNVLEG